MLVCASAVDSRPSCGNISLRWCHLTASSWENWGRPLGCPRTAWMKTIQQDLKSNNLSLNEAVDVAKNRPLWRLMSTFDATYS